MDREYTNLQDFITEEVITQKYYEPRYDTFSEALRYQSKEIDSLLAEENQDNV